MIEIDNLQEVMQGLNETTKTPDAQRKVIISVDAPKARDVLETALAEAEEFDNVIVLAFRHTKKETGGCGITVNARIAISGAHAALHALEVLRKTTKKFELSVFEILLEELKRAREDDSHA